MKYILLSSESIVLEIIPSENPTFPGIPLEKRYSADFIARLTPVEDDVEVEQNWTYDSETGVFSKPVIDDDPVLSADEALSIIVGGESNAQV